MRYSTNRRNKGNLSALKRVGNWDIALVEFIKNCRDKPFVWGEHDCLTFANNAVIVQRGYGFTGDKLGKYKTAKGAASAYTRWLKASGCSSIIEGVDAELERVVGFPPRGSVVAMPTPDGAIFPYSFGVMVSHLAAFITESGLKMIVPNSTFIAWRIE